MKRPQAIQISIPQPCSEDWHKMTPQDQGRYCDACKKCVVDFTGFTDRQLYDYYTQHANEKICGRFHNAQLNRPITIPSQPHSKLYRIAIALGLAIAIVTTGEQQSFAKAPGIEYNFINNYQTDDTTQNNTDSTYATIKGQVVDENGEPLINAVVELSLDGVVKAGVLTDYDGNFVIKIENPVSDPLYCLKTIYIGQKSQTVTNIKLQNNTVTTCNFKLESYTSGLTTGIILNTFKIPLIDPDNPGNGNRTITSDQIKHTAH